MGNQINIPKFEEYKFKSVMSIKYSRKCLSCESKINKDFVMLSKLYLILAQLSPTGCY